MEHSSRFPPRTFLLPAMVKSVEKVKVKITTLELIKAIFASIAYILITSSRQSLHVKQCMISSFSCVTKFLGVSVTRLRFVRLRTQLSEEKYPPGHSTVAPLKVKRGKVEKFKVTNNTGPNKSAKIEIFRRA